MRHVFPLNINFLQPRTQHHVTRDHTCILENTFFYSFVLHIISTWDALPSYVANMTTSTKNALIHNMHLRFNYQVLCNRGTTHLLYYAFLVSIAVA